MGQDLRAYLRRLPLGVSGLTEVDRSVSPHDFEITALLKQLDDRQKYPAVLFKNPIDLYNQPSPFQILTNLYATRSRCAQMLGLSSDDTRGGLARQYARLSSTSIAPDVLSRDAPVHDVIWTGADADIGRLPIVRHFAMDMGPTLTMTHVMRAPEGHYNISFAKTFYKWHPTEMVVSIHTRDMSRIVREYAARGEPAPIINVLGHHPAFHLGSLAPNAWGVNDYEAIGGFLDQPLRLAPSVTWGDRFMVPADAEVIIEGEIPPGRKDVCDPFGEVARLYQAQCLRPIFQVKAITFRRNPIIQDIFSGFADSFPLGAIPKEASLETALRPQFPNISEIHVPSSGCGVYVCYISIRDVQDGQVEAIGRAAFGRIGVLQCVVVVDADIDVFNEADVLWAIHTYPSLKDDFLPLTGDFAKHPGERSGFGTTRWGSKVVINATRPRHIAFGLRSEIPTDALARMKLSDFMPNI
jgi:UbiD family decarboxylase